jgi:hypothetical protein
MTMADLTHLYIADPRESNTSRSGCIPLTGRVRHGGGWR